MIFLDALSKKDLDIVGKQDVKLSSICWVEEDLAHVKRIPLVKTLQILRAHVNYYDWNALFTYEPIAKRLVELVLEAHWKITWILVHKSMEVTPCEVRFLMRGFYLRFG